MALRIVADLVVVACLAALGVMAKAWADELSSIGLALINNLAPILTAVVALVTAVAGLLAVVLKKVNTVHELVNSQYAKAREEIAAAQREIAALRLYIAASPGATLEDKIRALVSKEQSVAALPSVPGRSVESRP